MSEATLDRLDERSKSHADDILHLKAEIEALKLEIKAFWRIIYWGAGTIGGGGMIGGLLMPNIMKALGL